MKTIFGIVLCILVPAAVFSQLNQPVVQGTPDGKSISEPEFEGVFFRLVAGNLVPLEREPIKVSALIIAVKGVWDIPGGRSPVRFRTAEAMEFVVRAPSATADPADTYHLRKVVAKKAKREAKACARFRDCEFFLPLHFSRYGSSSYKISAPALLPGEYALRRTNAESVFCFGVD